MVGLAELFWLLLPWALGLGLLAVLGLIGLLLVEARRQGARTPDAKQEETYYDLSTPSGITKGSALKPFGSLFEEAEVDVTFVVPMYNEEERLPVMMEEALRYVAGRAAKQPGFSFEFILVDDGSKDKTVQLAEEIGRAAGPAVGGAVRVLRLHKNHGKGGAVRKGMLRARGRHCLMVDADGATKFADLEKLEAALRSAEVSYDDESAAAGGTGIAVGSRAHLQDDAVAQRSCFRTVLMKGFHVFVNVVSGIQGVQDTQCGFKLFNRAAARAVFPTQHIERWAFDVELLFLAASQRIDVAEVGVDWQEIDGSKLDVVSDSIKMAKDLMLIRFAYFTGLWAIESPMNGDAKRA